MKLFMKRSALVLLLMFMYLAPVYAGNLFAEAENVGTVTSIFPETGLIIIDGKRYPVSKNVTVMSGRGAALNNGLAGLHGGEHIQFAVDPESNQPVITGIIVVTDR